MSWACEQELRPAVAKLRSGLVLLRGTEPATQRGMKKPFDIRERTFLFACDVVGFSRALANRGHIMRRLAGQLVDAGCSIGANAAEAPGGQTKPDFITKNCIALKEAREARFWLRVIITTEPQMAAAAKPLLDEVNELVAIIYTIVKNARSNQRKAVARPF